MINEATLRFAHEHRDADLARLALSRPPEGVDLRAALLQIDGRRRMLRKVPHWGDQMLYPLRISVEQCSSTHTATYKAAMLQRLMPTRHSMADITGGMGVDFSYLAPLFRESHYVERMPELCEASAHNFPLLHLDGYTIHHSTAEAYLATTPTLDLLFADPARRATDGRRMVGLADCEPDLTTLQPTAWPHCRALMLKLSPMLDVKMALRQVRHVRELHIIASGGECKEIIVYAEKGYEGEPEIVCTDLRDEFRFTYSAEEAAPLLIAPTPEAYLYEPHAALMKAGAYKLTATLYGTRKLHPNTHLYTSTTLVNGFPGRTFRIIGTCPAARKDLWHMLGSNPKANLTVRNFPTTTATLAKKLKLRDGGHTYLFATTISTGQHLIIVCEKVAEAEV